MPAPVCLQCETGVAIFQVDSSTPPVFSRRGNSSLLDPHSTVKICERKIPAPGCGEAKESHEGCNMTKHHKSFTWQSPSFEVSCTPLRIFFGTVTGSVFSCSCFWRDPCSDTRLKNTRKFYWYSQFVCIFCKVSILIVPQRGSVSKRDWGECVCKEPSLPSGEIPSHPSHTATESHATLWGFLRKRPLQVKDPSTLLALIGHLIVALSFYTI